MNNERTVDKPVVENRNYKDTLFRMIFKEPEALLSLYNAVNGTNYTNPNDLKVVTLENAIYMNMKNDLALADSFLCGILQWNRKATGKAGNEIIRCF